jgi:hypothetical protein
MDIIGEEEMVGGWMEGRGKKWLRWGWEGF